MKVTVEIGAWKLVLSAESTRPADRLSERSAKAMASPVKPTTGQFIFPPTLSQELDRMMVRLGRPRL